MNSKIIEKEINIESTHLLLKTDINANLEEFIAKQRTIIQNEINRNPQFNGYRKVPQIEKPRILNLMTKASNISGIEKFDTRYSIIENGGDIALKTNKEAILAIYAGKSPFSNNIGLKLKPQKDSYGVCTSSGTVGPSKSFGKTDATIVLGKEASITDSLATQIGNYGNGEDDEEIVNNALEKAEEYSSYYDGVIVIKGEYLAKVGHIPRIVRIN